LTRSGLATVSHLTAELCSLSLCLFAAASVETVVLEPYEINPVLLNMLPEPLSCWKLTFPAIDGRLDFWSFPSAAGAIVSARPFPSHTTHTLIVPSISRFTLINSPPTRCQKTAKLEKDQAELQALTLKLTEAEQALQDALRGREDTVSYLTFIRLRGTGRGCPFS